MAASGQTGSSWQLLAEIYSWFTEGFDTSDLQDAQPAGSVAVTSAVQQYTWHVLRQDHLDFPFANCSGPYCSPGLPRAPDILRLPCESAWTLLRTCCKKAWPA